MGVVQDCGLGGLTINERGVFSDDLIRGVQISCELTATNLPPSSKAPLLSAPQQFMHGLSSMQQLY